MSFVGSHQKPTYNKGSDLNAMKGDCNMLYAFTIEFKSKMTYAQFKELSRFLHELSSVSLEFMTGPIFLFRGEEGNYTFKIDVEKIIIDLVK